MPDPLDHDNPSTDKLVRLYRPKQPVEFPRGVVAAYDERTNTVSYDASFFSMQKSEDFRVLRELREPYLVTAPAVPTKQ